MQGSGLVDLQTGLSTLETRKQCSRNVVRVPSTSTRTVRKQMLDDARAIRLRFRSCGDVTFSFVSPPRSSFGSDLHLNSSKMMLSVSLSACVDIALVLFDGGKPQFLPISRRFQRVRG
jgi:hypothetical protein